MYGPSRGWLECVLDLDGILEGTYERVCWEKVVMISVLMGWWVDV